MKRGQQYRNIYTWMCIVHINKFLFFHSHSSFHMYTDTPATIHILAYSRRFSRPLCYSIYIHCLPNTSLWPQSIHWFWFDGNKSLSLAFEDSNSIFDNAYPNELSLLCSSSGGIESKAKAVNRIVSFHWSAFQIHHIAIRYMSQIRSKKTWTEFRSASLIQIYWLQHIRIRL